MRWVFSRSAIFWVKYLFSLSRYDIFKKSCFVSPVWCGGGWLPVRLAGNTFPTVSSSLELVSESSFFFFLSFLVSFFLGVLTSSFPPTRADYAPDGIPDDFIGLKFLMLNMLLFFFLGVSAAAPWTGGFAPKGGNLFLSLLTRSVPPPGPSLLSLLLSFNEVSLFIMCLCT